MALLSSLIDQAQGQVAGVRRLPISPELQKVLDQAARAAGVSVRVTSGGQPAAGSGGPRTGSTRHDLGHAADLELLKDGRLLSFTNPDDRPVFERFVSSARSAGATGIGAGEGYMGPHRLHVGFGTPAVWGAGGRSANAPDWLRRAAGGSGGTRVASAGGEIPASAAPARQPSAALPGLLSSIEGNQEMANGPRGILDTIAQGNPLLDLGLGILAASGDQPLGQALAQGAQFAQTRGAARMENDIIRERLLQQQRQQRGVQQLQGLLSDPNFDPASPQALGILSTIAPDAVASGLINQAFPSERAEPSDVRTIRAMGLDPSEGEGRKLLMDKFLSEGGTSEQLDMLLKGLQIDKIQREREDEISSEDEERKAQIDTLDKTVTNLSELAELNDSLEGTALETGTGLNDLRRGAVGGAGALARNFGLDDRGASQLVADFDRFDKLANDFIVRLIENMPGTTTNQRQELLQRATVSVGAAPGANRLIIADLLEETFRAADREDITIPDREEGEALIEKLRAPPEEPAPESEEPAAQRGPGVPRIKRMSREALRRVDPFTLSEEELRAATQRWEELGVTP